MSSTGEDNPLNLEKDVERAIVLLDRLRTTSEIPETKLTELQRIFQSDFFRAVMEVYEKIYETVQISGSPEVRANATAKATVRNFSTRKVLFHDSNSLYIVHRLQLSQRARVILILE